MTGSRRVGRQNPAYARGVLRSDLVDAYLARLGVDREAPSVEALQRLHRAHVERVPYETLWIHLGEAWSTDVVHAAERIAHQGRGGYCFQLNGALAGLLDDLGYHVTRHVGGVHGPLGLLPEDLTNHLVLIVHDLPTDENPGGRWYVDAGLGDALHEPLPLVAGTYQQGPFWLGLEQTDGGPADWHLTHDPAGGFAGMGWRAAAATAGAFDERHRWLSTSPESGFVKVLTVQRRDASGVDVLRGLTCRRVGVGAADVDITSVDELVDVLHGTFGLPVDELGVDRIRALWGPLHASHLAWVAAGRP